MVRWLTAFSLVTLVLVSCAKNDELAEPPRTGGDCPKRPECVTGTICELDPKTNCEVCKCDPRVPPPSPMTPANQAK